MTCELLNPRTGLPDVAAKMYRALKTAGCRCVWAWGKSGYAPVTQCATCAAIEAYEELTMANA